MNKIKLFDDMSALASFAEQARTSRAFHDVDRNDFYQGSMFDATRKAREGDLEGVESSEALLAKLEALTFETSKRFWRDDVAGALPNVQAFISGQPMTMRRRDKAPSDMGAVRIVVDVFASAAFTPDQIRARGAAVLALVRLLSRARPVELWVVCASSENGKNTAPFVRIDTAPLDLAHAAFALTAPLFLRRIMFAACASMGTHDSIPLPVKGALRSLASEAFQDGAQTILVPGIVSNKDAVVANPQQWIIDQIRAASPESLAEGA